MNTGRFQDSDDCRKCGAEVAYVHYDRNNVRHTWRACSKCKTVHPIFKRESGKVVAYIRCLEQEIPKVQEVQETMAEEEQPQGDATPESIVPDTGDKAEVVKELGKVAAIKELLLEGYTRKQVGKMKYEPTGELFNPGSIRIAASELKQVGQWDPDEEKAKEKLEGGGKPALTTTGLPAGRDDHHLTVFAKGSPPEAIIDAISVPMIGSPDFEKGLKFGMSTMVMAVRVMQELAQVGAMQAKPLISLSREMRAGEEAAAKNAAQESAVAAGKEFLGIIGPSLDKIDALSASAAAPVAAPGENPMLNMMMRAMEPMFKGAMDGMVKKLMPGAEIDKTPSSWTRERR